MTTTSAKAISHPNIAFIKYWGNQNHSLRLPANGSISMTLAGLETEIMVCFDSNLDADRVMLDGERASPKTQRRVIDHLQLIRKLAGISRFASVDSQSNFPVGAGLASSASAFAALTLAATHAAGLQLNSRELSRLARRGSGSASRSILGGFVECLSGDKDEDSFAIQIVAADHWKLVDWIAIVDVEPKETGSSEGHILASSSPLQAERIATAPARIAACRQAILQRDFAQLATVAELDCNLMHAVMLTSSPPLLYWQQATLRVLRAVSLLRAGGIPVFYTVDAGPNVHCICPFEVADEVGLELQAMHRSMQWIRAEAGEAARLVES